jgi:hypothetical protein
MLTDMGGDSMTVVFEVLDNRPLASVPMTTDDPTTVRGPYAVTVSESHRPSPALSYGARICVFHIMSRDVVSKCK